MFSFHPFKGLHHHLSLYRHSFGVILYELVACEEPWAHLNNPMQVVGAVGFNRQRLQLPNDLQPEVSQLINDCWSEAPQHRPSFAEVLDRLGQLPGLVPSLSKRLASAARDE